MPILPPRPYPVATGFIVRRTLASLGLVLLGLGCIGGGGWWQGREIEQLRGDLALWQTGRSAEIIEVTGRETSHDFVLNSYDLDVKFDDTEGHPRGGKLKFNLLFASVPDNSPVSVKYDPADPTRYTVSWAVEHARARWASAIGFLVVFCGLFGLGSLALSVAVYRQIGDVRNVAERSLEVALELVSIRPVMVNGKHSGNVVSFRYGVGNAPIKERKQQLYAKDSPLFTSATRSHVVALVSPHAPDRPWIVRESLFPFELPVDAIAKIRATTKAA